MHMWEMSMKRTMNLGTAPCTFSSLAQNYLGTGALCVICHPWKSIKCFHDSNPDVIFWLVGQSSRTPKKQKKNKTKTKNVPLDFALCKQYFFEILFVHIIDFEMVVN